MEFEVLFLASRERRRKWNINLKEANFDYLFLNEPKIQISYENTRYLPYFLIKQLIHEQPCVIISGGFSFSTIVVFMFSLITGIPFIVWSGETLLTESSRFKLKKIIRSVLIHKSSAVVTYGSKASEYIRTLNRTKPIFIAYNTIDTDYFSENAKNFRQNILDEKNRLIRFYNKKNILFVGGLVKRKGTHLLLSALSKLQSCNNDFWLHIVGDGPEKENLICLAEKAGISNRVIFWGNKDKQELAMIYSIADIFVFPSLHEIWGLVLNEAMASGLPVISSKFAGATYDLVEDGINGFIVNPYKIEEFADKIKILLENPSLCRKMGNIANKTIVQKFNVSISAEGFLKAIMYNKRF